VREPKKEESKMTLHVILYNLGHETDTTGNVVKYILINHFLVRITKDAFL
jgi:hypothetical protein